MADNFDEDDLSSTSYSDADDCYENGDVAYDDYSCDSADENIGDEAYDDCSSDSADENISLNRNYNVLTLSEIHSGTENAIDRLCTLLFVSKDSATSLLLYYKWRVDQIHNEWFADEEKVRNAVGLLQKPVMAECSMKKLKCPICLEICRVNGMKSAACGHLFCQICWAGYVGTAINDGRGCLTLRCPFPDCKAAVGQDMIRSYASEEEKEKYSRYFYRSFVEDCIKTKWCPAPGCDFAVKFDGGGENYYDVCCRCSYSFCWNCTEETHRPLDCATVRQWLLKNKSESENVTWILANSKQCPKCNRPIEKNQGCMHMTCSAPCNFQFCWLCLGAWSEHGKNTGGFYACNIYEEAKQSGKLDEAERQREMAKNSMERYTHYYERWANNQKSREKAAADLERMRSEHIDKLITTQHEPEAQLKFIIDAWEQITECRRFLKWTYAYGYYLPQEQLAKKRFFEYLQGEAESALEKLHQCAENELEPYILADDRHDGLSDFRMKLAGLTGVTKSFFKNLERALENGLKDVESST